MKFVQYRLKIDGSHRLGVLGESSDDIKELTGFPGDLKGLIESGATVDDIEKCSASFPSVSKSEVEILAPITDPQKILCVGFNYRGHCDELKRPHPVEPIIFSKFASAIVGPFDNVVAHKASTQIDWEVELAVVVGRRASKVTKEGAMSHVFGYTIAQDISARDWQFQRNGGQYLMGKSMDTFCPLGSCVVHQSAIDVSDLSIKCSINGVLKQNGRTSELIFDVSDLIAWISQSITLEPGDVILTGTPFGVGMNRNPPEFLKLGDVIESEIEGIGGMVNRVVEG